MIWPDTFSEASLNKNRVIEAISSFSTNVFNETIDSNSFLTFLFEEFINLAFAFITLSILSPLTEPGQIAFTRILNFPNSTANVLVNPIIAHLLDAYGERWAKPYNPAVEDKLMIDPFFAFFKNGIANFVK